MPRLAANLGMLFTEQPFLDRFAAAASAGFEAVEYFSPYEHPATVIRELLDRNRLQQALFNLPAGDRDAGESGLAILPGRRDAFAASLELALGYAQALGCPRLHVMAGCMPAGLERREAEATYLANLRWATSEAARARVGLMIEPINPIDLPGYFLANAEEARCIIEAVGSDNLWLQLDLYHRQMTDGGLARSLTSLMPIVRHIQIAGVPGRHEPDIGEINYPYLLDLIDSLGYRGWIGCEYRPRAGTLAGLGWAARHGVGPGRARS